MIIRTNRAKPRLQILRGWDLVNTATLNQVHPVKAGVTIKSGQVIQRTWNGTLNRYEWELGCSAINGIAKAPFFAFQDSTEADVIAADGLTGISISGDYELQTGYFSSGTYNADTLLTFDGTSGRVKPAAEGELVIGRVTRIRGPLRLNGAYAPTDPADTVPAFNPPVNSETVSSAASDPQGTGASDVITFETSNMGYLQAVDADTTPVPG
jgi:hypothetical protein